MKIDTLNIKIGNRKEIVKGMDLENQEVNALLKHGKVTRCVIDVEVPCTAPMASTVGLVVFLKAQAKARKGEVKVKKVSEGELIANLSKKIGEVEFSVRAYHAFEGLRVEYLWQVAERSEGQLLKLKNFSKKSVQHVKEILAPLGLYTGMELGQYRDLLPQVIR